VPVGRSSSDDQHASSAAAAGLGRRLSGMMAKCLTKATMTIEWWLDLFANKVASCSVIAHRNGDWYPDLWDLPGGHVGENELEAQALTRELWEELGIRVEPPQSEPFAHV
jgi:8-oxo-dGTP pyrophosphatase MutT (NUDIX family)